MTAVIVNKTLVKELRIKHSYSQEKLAAIVGVNLRTIQRIESNGVASLDTRGALANALGVMPEDLDVEEASVVAIVRGRPERPPRALLVVAGAALVVLGVATLAIAIYGVEPIGLMTPPAVIGLSISMTGLLALARVTPLRRWRIYAVLCIVAISLLLSPPAWAIQGLAAISLWGAFELGILLTRFRMQQSQV